MSSRVFQARSAHSAQKPQLCGLSKQPISKDDWIMYLVCHGSNARPEYQIKVVAERQVEKEYFCRYKRRKVKKEVTERDYGMGGRTFRTVYDGKKLNPATGKKEKNFIWQELIGLDADGEQEWRTVKCWSHIVHAQAAADLGYEVREDASGNWAKTEAFDGDRAVGSEHTVEVEEDNAMVTLARAALTEEEAGLVPPTEAEESEAEAERINAEIAVDAETEDKRDAEALGMSLEQYRKVMQANS